MSRNQRKYTEEYKREAVRLMASSGKSIAEVARDLPLAGTVWAKGNGTEPGQDRQRQRT